MPFCPNYGTKISDNAKFCMECGSKLGDYRVEISPKFNVSPHISAHAEARTAE